MSAACCTVGNCTKKPVARGWCTGHYGRFRRYGDPTFTKRARFTGSPTERFWPRVIKTDTCWIWNGAKTPFGYGRLGVGEGWVMAHRFSWELANGPIPEGLFILHHCDNPPCVRPDHLFVGTLRDNTRDMTSKGRNRPPRGVLSGRTHLTETDVRRMREMYASGTYKQQQLADAFGIAENTVSLIVNRKRWAHIV